MRSLRSSNTRTRNILRLLAAPRNFRKNGNPVITVNKRYLYLPLLPLILAFPKGGLVFAQDQPSLTTRLTESSSDNPVNRKALAKYKHQASQLSQIELANAKRQFARDGYDARFRRYMSGKETFDLVFGALAPIIQTELSREGDKAARIRLLKAQLRQAESVEDIWRRKFAAVAASRQDVLEATCERIEAQLALLKAMGKTSEPGQLHDGSLFDQIEHNWEAHDYFDGRDIARHEFKALQGDPKLLEATRSRAARLLCEMRMERLGGLQLVDVAINCALRLLKAEQAISNDGPSRYAALERHWARLKWIEEQMEMRYERGVARTQDLLAAQYHRLQAQLWLAQAKIPTGPLPAFAAEKYPGSAVIEINGVAFLQATDTDVLDRKELARARFEATQTTAHELTVKMLQTGIAGFKATGQRFAAGKTTLSEPLAWSERLLEARLALSPEPTDRLSAYETYWLQLVEVEYFVTLKFESGSASWVDYLDSKYARVAAQLRLAQEMAGDNDRR
jgi:hypothetical protein